MVRDIRIKEYKFTSSDLSGAAVSTSTGSAHFGAYSQHPLNGTIQAIEYVYNNFAKAGSIGITISGTGETIIACGSDTAFNWGSTQTIYPHVYTYDSVGNIGSPQTFTQRVVNSTIYIWGSGVGTGSTATSLSIKYI